MNITRKRVDELREELQARGLDSTGKRPILLRRLRAALDSSPSSTPRLPAQDASAANSSGHVDTDLQSTPDQSAHATPVSTTDQPASAAATHHSISSPSPVTTRQPAPVSHVERNLQASGSGAETTAISEPARSNLVDAGAQANTTAPLNAVLSKAIERTVENVEIAQSKASVGNNREATTDAKSVNLSKDVVGGATNDDSPSKSTVELGAASTKTLAEAAPASTPSSAATTNGRPFRKLQRMVPPPENESVEEAILRRRKRFGVPADVKIEKSDTVVETATEQAADKRDDEAEGTVSGKGESGEKVVEKEAEEDSKSKVDRREGRPKGIVKQRHRGRGKAGTGGRPGSRHRGNSADRFSHDQGGRRYAGDRRTNGGQPWHRRQSQGSVSPAQSRGSSPRNGSEVNVKLAFRGRTGERWDASSSRRGRGYGRGRGHGRGRGFGRHGNGQGRGNSQGQRVMRQDDGRPSNDRSNNDRPNNDGTNNDVVGRGKKRRSSGDDDGYRGDEVNRSRANGDGEANEVVRGRMQRFTAGMPNSSSASGRTKDGDGLGAEEVDRRLKRQRRFHLSSSKN